MYWWHAEITFRDGRKGSVCIKARDYGAAVLLFLVRFAPDAAIGPITNKGPTMD